MCQFLIYILAATFLTIGEKTIEVEIADTDEKRKVGLQGRESLQPDSGMLFIFSTPEVRSFWMKDTLIPLSIGFFDKERVLLNIEEMEVPKKFFTLKHYLSAGPIVYALEVPSGWYALNKIVPGMKFSLENASQDQTSPVK